MVKIYNKDRLEENVLEFESKIHVLDDKSSISTISLPYPAVKKLNWDKDTELEVIVRKK